ncbi:hypothetical protein BZL30_9398 [Mycobacterium kansasii]|uniref:Uncharacterized protein n=1 Tax=Mycobacterium kansasii TaxID=1768 RepID=A0A1V3WBW3_MYCKA|nr:hypothetical protein BZL30_9398 [Mycobacterium kansasii]
MSSTGNVGRVVDGAVTMLVTMLVDGWLWSAWWSGWLSLLAKGLYRRP